MKSLSEIDSEIKACTKCGLCKQRNNTVPGEGPADASILIIAEGPGAEEDATGRPFVGRSGMLLRRTLSSLGMNVFIANVVKCRPPQNRKPTPAESETCKPYLLEQIKIINPKVIILLGNTALEAILGETGITTLRGKIIEKDGIKYIPTFHPAAVLRDMKRIEEFKKDLELAKSLCTD